jgi:hypothetical protein
VCGERQEVSRIYGRLVMEAEILGLILGTPTKPGNCLEDSGMVKTRNYYEILLANLVGRESPEWEWFMPRKEAYQALKDSTGQDFGFDCSRWKAWLVQNGRIPHDKSPLTAHQWNSLIEPLERLLVNLELEIDPDDVFLYMEKDAAVQELKRITGQDFGCDARQWRQWLQDTSHARHGRGSWLT